MPPLPLGQPFLPPLCPGPPHWIPRPREKNHFCNRNTRKGARLGFPYWTSSRLRTDSFLPYSQDGPTPTPPVLLTPRGSTQWEGREEGPSAAQLLMIVSRSQEWGEFLSVRGQKAGEPSLPSQQTPTSGSTGRVIGTAVCVTPFLTGLTQEIPRDLSVPPVVWGPHSKHCTCPAVTVQSLDRRKTGEPENNSGHRLPQGLHLTDEEPGARGTSERKRICSLWNNLTHRTFTGFLILGSGAVSFHFKVVHNEHICWEDQGARRGCVRII